MTRYFAFNGDADGLCALQQLRLACPGDATLVTGVKRDIHLLDRIDAGPGDTVAALDISLEQNRGGLLRLLAAGARVDYFDHHHAGELPAHRGLCAHIDEGADVCTSILVDRHLGGRHRRWAVTAAFGDNLSGVARLMAAQAGLDACDIAVLERLGTCLNYNAYGECVADLHFDPAELAAHMLPFADPLDFAAQCAAYRVLCAGYADDMAQARCLAPSHEVPGAALLVLPDAAWARRAIGVLANELVSGRPGDAIGLLSPKTDGGFAVSVRVPAHSATGAADFCRGFDTGGGRRLAGGINHLPDADVDRFTRSFTDCFGRA
ncbi:acetyltransferase [Cupriavidus pinatubonensis]|uniref:acetyltransferase n=1 Tax=Cupriavidus pinatubonensis TaxID=248026 RepID=UPI001C73C6F5|nr:acetyltransferase [Cupriavidus pinatubonensis]QYY33087.1 acetyltransferase [Cupriavidus pinatubonensis]